MITRSLAERGRYSLAYGPAVRVLALFAFVAFLIAQPGHAVARALIGFCIALFGVIVHAS